MPKANQATTLKTSTVIKPDGTKIDAPAKTIPYTIGPDIEKGLEARGIKPLAETDEQKMNRLVNERVAIEMAAQAQDAATDSMPAHEETKREEFTAQLLAAIKTLAELFDIDIEQVHPDQPPVQYAQGTLLRDLCYMMNRNIEYNKRMLQQRSESINKMCNQHRGDEQSDTSIQNMTIFMRGLEDQLELWTCADDAAKEAHSFYTGNEYGVNKRAAIDQAGATAAVSEARKIASRHLAANPKAEANRADNEKKALLAENELLRKAVSDTR